MSISGPCSRTCDPPEHPAQPAAEAVARAISLWLYSVLDLVQGPRGCLRDLQPTQQEQQLQSARCVDPCTREQRWAQHEDYNGYPLQHGC